MNNQNYLAIEEIAYKAKKFATNSLIVSIQLFNKSYLADNFKLNEQLSFCICGMISNI